MKMIIAGGRNFIGTHNDYDSVVLMIKKYKVTEIVSGCAKGADKFGEYCANLCGLPIKEFPAEWNKYGRQTAGKIRNTEMAQYTDFVFLFPGGNGTADMRAKAKYYNKEIVYDGGAK